jgi:hypothetical protein
MIACVIMFRCTVDCCTSKRHMTDRWINGMYVSMYLVMYVCMYVRVCIYIYIYVYTHTYIHTYIHKSVCARVYKGANLQRLLDIRIIVLIYIYIFFLLVAASG